MTKYYYICMFMLLAFVACNKDEEGTLSPSYKDTNWFVLKDSDDPVDHIRYEIFKSTGICVYYNDTIGKQFRGIDGYGDSVFHYEVLEPEYGMGEFLTSSYTHDILYDKSTNRTAIQNGVEFVRDRVVPMLNKSVYPRSILLVENLRLNASQTVSYGNRIGNVYKGLATTVVSRIADLDTMSNEGKNLLAAEVAGEIWYPILITKFETELTKDFTNVSLNSVQFLPGGNFTTTIHKRPIMKKYLDDPDYVPWKPYWTEYGFLTYNPEQMSSSYFKQDSVKNYSAWYTPTLQQDVISFAQVVCAYPTEAAFEEAYGEEIGYDLLLQKYRIIKRMMNALKEE